MREFPDSFFDALEQVFVDTPVALEETGDLVISLEKGLNETESIFPLWDLIQGNIQPCCNTRFFKPVGMAAFDLYGAKLLYENHS